MRLTLAVLLVLPIILGGHLSPITAEQDVSLAFPAGCGPRHAVQPAAGAVPFSPVPLGRALPIYGGPMSQHDLAAAGGTVVASTFPSWALANTLYMSTDDGQSWTHMPTPPGMENSMRSVVLSTDGRRLAGTDLHHLFILRRITPTEPRSAWVSYPVQNLWALVFDPADSNRLVGLGGDIGQEGHVTVFNLSDDERTTLRVQSRLPLPLGQGQSLVVMNGTTIVALGQGPQFLAGSGLPVRVFVVPLAGGRAPELPQPPNAATSPVYSLSADPGGSLYLITQGGLFVLPPGAATWEQRPMPPGAANAGPRYLAATGSQLYLATNDTDGRGRLWRADRAGGDWRPVAMALPAEHISFGQPVPDGTRVWVPTTAGPVLLRPDGNGELRTNGIAAPVTVVASAAWRPTRVVAGWGGGLFFTDDGGRSWVNRTPPVNHTVGISEIGWTADGACVAVIYGNRIFLSDNLGQTWKQLPDRPVRTVTESPVGSGTWWAAPGPYRSAPGRAVWTRVDLPEGAGSPEAVRRFGTLIRMARAQDGLWLGGFFGVWHLQLPPVPGPIFTYLWGAGVSGNGVVASPYDPSVVYSGLRRTVDGGRTWDLPVPGPADVLPARASPRWMAFGPDHPGAVLSTTRVLVRDDGRSWVPFWSPPGPGQSIAGVAPAGPGRYYVAVQKLGLVVVQDSVTRWHPPTPPSDFGRWTPPPSEPGPASLLKAIVEATAPSDPQTLYRLTPDGKLDVSRDGGRNFLAPRAVALEQGRACCWTGAGPNILASVLAVSPADPNRLYVGLTLNGAGAFQPELGLWISDDGGVTWHRSGFPMHSAIQGIAVAPGSPNTLYAVATTRLWRSVDDGSSWTLMKSPPEAAYSVATPTATEVLVGGAGKMWRSEDRGQTFTELPLVIPTWGKPEPRLSGVPIVAVLRAPTGTLFAGSGGGVALSTDGGRTWQVVSKPVGDPPVLPGGLDLRADGSVAVATVYGTFVYRMVRPPRD